MEFQDQTNLYYQNMLKISNFKDQKVLCDIVIIVNSMEIYAHSCVLAAASPTLFDILAVLSSNERSMAKPLKLNLSQVSLDKITCESCISQIIDFIYNGKICSDLSHVQHIIELSNYLKMENLNALFSSSCQKELSNTSSYEGSGSIEQSNACNVKAPVSGNRLGSLDSNNVNLKQKCSVTNTACHTRVGIPVSKDWDNGVLTCAKCSFQFDSTLMYNYHKKVFHTKKFICLSCDFSTMKLSFMIFHLLNKPHEVTCCSVCLYETKDVNSLKVHFNDHKKEFPYKCYTCGNAFKGRYELLRHIVLLKKDNKCPKKSQAFNSASIKTDSDLGSLKSNDSGSHQNKLPKTSGSFICPVNPCPFSTKYKSNLKVHLQSHEASKIFACEMCSLKFTLEKNLIRHRITKHCRQTDVYKCCQCSYQSARIDKAKLHCELAHENDPEVLNNFLRVHQKNKDLLKKERRWKREIRSKKENDESLKTSDTQTDIIHSESNNHPVGKTYILSENTGEFQIISKSRGEAVSVASMTSTNVLTIGNFREGTGSVTLNETTGLLKLNNINSDSTGAVFLNESTGELSYINLGKESSEQSIEKPQCDVVSKVYTQLDEYTGEILIVNKENEPMETDDDGVFDPFDMDLGNDDSCDGFDDIDGIIFETFDFGNPEMFLQDSDENSPTEIPHLNEATGELSFDHVETNKDAEQSWKSNINTLENNKNEESNDSNTLLLNEVTGELVIETDSPKM